MSKPKKKDIVNVEKSGSRSIKFHSDSDTAKQFTEYGKVTAERGFYLPDGGVYDVSEKVGPSSIPKGKTRKWTLSVDHLYDPDEVFDHIKKKEE